MANSIIREKTFEKELDCAGDNPIFVIGVDEAGRGPLAGPVVAAAVCYKDQSFHIPEDLKKNLAQIRDSKKLSEKQREKLFGFIEEYFYTGVGIVGAETIDRINILQATFLAMKSAAAALKKQLAVSQQKIKKDMYLLIDGNQLIPNFSYLQEAIVGGDDSVKSIAAASIVAKVTRDRIMSVTDKKYPGYGFAKHKGYGTREHMDALRRLGPCPIHRRSFKPVWLSIPDNANRSFSGILKPRKK